MANDLITIDLWCREKKGTYKVEIVDRQEDVPKSQEDEWTLVRFFMKPLTWKLHTDLIRAATIAKRVKSMGGKGKGTMVDEIDWSLYRQNKALLSIDSWNIVDEDGNKIPVSDDAIMSMHPDVLERLLDRYDSTVLVTKARERALMMKTFKYYQSVYGGSGNVEAPPEVVELSLMEKFHWTPQQIAEIPYRKIQELFIILNQRDNTQSQTQDAREFISSEKAKRKA
jgi:hypothetical protein